MRKIDQPSNTPSRDSAKTVTPSPAERLEAGQCRASQGARKLYMSADVRELIKNLNAPGQGWFPVQYKKLQEDPKDLVSCALNMLQPPHPEGVLFAAAQAAELAEDRQEFVKGCREWAAWFETKSRETLALAEGVRMLAPLGHQIALSELAKYLAEQATFYRQTVEKAPISRKSHTENARVIVVLRALRQKLYGHRKHVPHDPLVFLVQAALGVNIPRAAGNQWPGWVLAALRNQDADSGEVKEPRIRKTQKIKK
jgi:hypothetical protein